MPSLMYLFLVPLLASLVMFVLPLNASILKRLAFITSLIPLGMLLYGGSNWLGSDVSYPWLPQLNVNFHLKIDGLSIVFLYLVALIIPITLLSIHSSTLNLPGAFFGFTLLTESLLIGFFTAQDLILFTLFWEAMLIPLYFIISLWGGEYRRQAAIKFLIYMIAGSSLMLAAVLFLFFNSNSQGTGSFDISTLARFSENFPYAGWCFAFFLLAFAVKTPLFPFHAWLPDAYYQASIPGTILLSALLSKAGIYGIARIGFELFPHYMRDWGPTLLIWGITGVIYGALAAWGQRDFKRLLAYSSFSHVNFILAGLFIWDQSSHVGAVLQAFNHGITITALFLAAQWLSERMHSTTISDGGGLAKSMPMLCWLTFFFILSSVALPGTNNFIGELMVLFGALSQGLWFAVALGSTVILSVIYMLRWMQKVYFEEPKQGKKLFYDIGIREEVIALPLVLIILWVGFYPQPLIDLIKPMSEKFLAFSTLRS